MNTNLPSWYDPRIGQPSIQQHTGISWLAQHAGKFVPAATTTTALILARIWHEQGAAGSWGDMALMIVLSAAMAGGAALSGLAKHGDSITMATALTAAGAFLLVGPAAYTDSEALALIVWLVATVLVYAVTGRHWREDRRTREARTHELTLTRLEGLQALELQAQRGSDAERIAVQLQQLEAARLARAALDTRSTHSGLDPMSLVQLAVEQETKQLEA
ncbi:hypothetical protein [Streptomyces sp. NPDC088733]|uniref:hypothetical protein n=1 Tax=Streptomyces sp. NPDC088733 TaxID=3365880 RepID=UPI0038243BB2